MLEFKILDSKQIGENEKEVVTKVVKSNGTLSVHEVTRLVEAIRRKGEQKYPNFKVPLIRVLNGARWASFSTEDAFNDYYDGHVKDPSKFDKIFQVQITTSQSD